MVMEMFDDGSGDSRKQLNWKHQNNETIGGMCQNICAMSSSVCVNFHAVSCRNVYAKVLTSCRI